jgi:hypothetical protein
MHNWFQCKISYEKADNDGLLKKVTEPYLVDALSFTEAEARIIEEMRPYISGEFTVTDIKRARFWDTFFNETGEKYYKVKIIITIFDDNAGKDGSRDKSTYKEKKTALQILAQASTVLDAVKVVEEGMAGSMQDYELSAVVETTLMNVFPYVPKPKIGESENQEA